MFTNMMIITIILIIIIIRMIIIIVMMMIIIGLHINSLPTTIARFRPVGLDYQWAEPQIESTEIHQRFTDNDGDDDLMTLIYDDDL